MGNAALSPPTRRRRVTADLIERLQRDIGCANVATDPDVLAQFETDWTRRFTGRATALVRPASCDEVVAVVRRCAEAGVPIVVQGGNTGLVAGATPRGGEILLSTSRLDTLGEVDLTTGEIEVGAGVQLIRVQEAAAAAGFDVGLDFGARQSATMGGIAATDAGGTKAVRYGTARNRIGGLEAVLGDGTLIDRLQRVRKDNAGYALHELLIGSEGTLGVVTKLRWQLVPALPERLSALVPLRSSKELRPLFAALQAHAPSLEAVDFMLHNGLRLTADHLNLPLPAPADAPLYAILECAGREDPTAELADALEAVGIEDAVLATDSHDRNRLWRFREAHNEAIADAGMPHKLDVGVPLDHLSSFLETVPGLVAGIAPGASTYLFGHLGDGNVHVNVVGVDPDDPEVDGAVLSLVADSGGTVSAEHGIGTLKARWLGLVRTSDEVEAMRRVKEALDPSGILSPGSVLGEVLPRSGG
jgi:FAD/FMN-containing dehydrogenase